MLSGKALAETILREIGNFTLDISNCRGQEYDGTASVSGHKADTLIVTVTN